MVVGSLASNGELPWNIRGRRVWIAVALASKRGVDQSWNLSQSDSNYVDIATIENPTNNWQLAASNTGADGTGQYVSSLSTEADMLGDKDHCHQSYISEQLRRQLPPEMRE